MPMLRRIVELGCTLIDYERIVDEQGQRLVFFGRYAGLAGMIDTLWTLGRRLEYEGVGNPFAAVRRAYEYDNLEHAKREIGRIGERIRQEGLPNAIQPFVCGFTGYGNVSQGAQEIFDLLPTQVIDPTELDKGLLTAGECYKVVFREEHLAERTDGGSFELRDYYDHPEKYRCRFSRYLEHLTVLMNCIYWAPQYPRLVTREQLRKLFSDRGQPRLRVIGDITCDIGGSVECTVQATEPGDPVYVYEPLSEQLHDGVAGNGPVILAVDILPCELPVDSSTHFGRSLSPFIPALARADFGGRLHESGLPPELQRATIAYRGRLTELYRYLETEIS
jgi:saccharopine dehydrogenase (NAD+, L-lysine-forming)